MECILGLCWVCFILQRSKSYQEQDFASGSSTAPKFAPRHAPYLRNISIFGAISHQFLSRMPLTPRKSCLAPTDFPFEVP